jgi:hypothetical protein
VLRLRLIGRDPTEHCAQLVHVKWFREVMIETGSKPALGIFLLSKSR